MEVIGMDPATAKLAVELQLTDVNEILGGLEAKDDEYAAFQAMRAGFQDTMQLLEGQALALNILKAERANQIQFERLVREERQAVQDHDLARQLAGLAPKRPRSPQPENDYRNQDVRLSDDEDSNLHSTSTITSSKVLIATTLDKTQSSFYFEQDYGGMFKVVDEPKTQASGPSTPVPSKAKAKEVDARDEHPTHTFCSACMDRHARFDVLELNCKRQDDVANHAYCRTCLIDLFKSSITDTTLFPPRCCGVRIPLSTCVHLFPSELVKQYEEKEVELATPNPIYCSNRFCTQFIRPGNVIADVATCPTCDAETCTVCKNPNHKGLCPEDPTVQMLMDVAGEKKWQRCYKCRTMVELLVGCYHMRCRCGGQFCYLCAKPWKTCSCSQWDENRLLLNGRAVDTPARQIAMPEEEEVPEADPAVDVLNDLHLRLATVAGGFAINNDDEEPSDEGSADVGGCAHQWQRVYGKRGELEVCGICHYHLEFVNNCTMCGTKVCNRCLNNRL